MRQRQTLGTLGVMRVVCGSIAISLAATSGAAAAAEEDQDYHRRALQAFTEARYEQALQLFSLGYAETKQPDLLIRIGQTYLKLGRNAEALQACESYISRVENPAPLYKGYAEQCIAEAKRPTAARTPGVGRVTTTTVVDAAPLPAPLPAPPPLAALPGDPGSLPPATDSKPAALGATVTPPTTLGTTATPPAAVTPGLMPTPLPAPTTPLIVAASVPPPVNLNGSYDQCLQYQRDGRTDAARSCYLEFLPGALRLGGIPEGDVGPLMTQLQRFPEPSSAFPPLLRKYEDRRNTGLWSAGLTLWLSAMVPAVSMSAAYYLPGENNSSNRTIFYTMMIPVVGPFIAGIWLPLSSPPGDTRNNTLLHFSLPWMVADGLAQLVGFTMFLGGVQTRRLPIPPAVERVLSRTRIAPYGDPNGGGVAAMGRF